MSEVCDDCLCLVRLPVELRDAGKEENDALRSLKEDEGSEE